jgi:hypothetical protein
MATATQLAITATQRAVTATQLATDSSNTKLPQQKRATQLATHSSNTTCDRQQQHDLPEQQKGIIFSEGEKNRTAATPQQPMKSEMIQSLKKESTK